MGVLRLSIVLVAICLLKVKGIRIRGADSIIYDPANPPSTNRFACENDMGQPINDATWRRNGTDVEANLVDGGRLILEPGTIEIENNPQKFEGRYRCHSNGDRSEELEFYVAPSRVLLESFTENRELEGENVAIDCPLRFGKLRDGWSVEWTVKDSQGNTMHPSEYFNRTNPKFQLVIKKASFDYEEATFVCQALRGHTIYQESQTITLNLFHEPEITTRPSDPVIVDLTHGIVTYEIKAYPRPTVRFCYNNTCSNTGHGRIQITNHNNNDTSHKAQFTINTMTEEDNGNVTLELSQSERNFTKNYTVMIFLPYKLRLTKNGSITDRRVPLLITLRSPLHFEYHIDFVDMENKPLGSMEGMRGQTTLMHMLSVEKDTDVMARFRIGEVSGPDSDPVSVDVENPETTENNESDNNMIFIVVAVLVAVVLLAVIGAVTYLIGKKWKRKENTPRNIESGTTNENISEAVRMQSVAVVQNGINGMAMNPINRHPDIAIHAPTPGHNMPGHNMPGIYPQGLMLARQFCGSTNSDQSSIHSRKSSMGYESGTESCLCTRCSPCASNYQPPRRCCNCDQHYTSIPQHQQHHQQLQEQPEDEQDNGELVNNQQQPAVTTNLSNPKSSMRRNLSDPNISRHKQPPPSRSLEERTTKLLSSSSVV